MRHFRTWKQMQTRLSSSAGQKSFDSFLKEEFSDSRRIVRDVIKQKPIIDFGVYRSSMLRNIEDVRVKTNASSA